MAEDLLLRSYKEIVGEKKEQQRKQGYCVAGGEEEVRSKTGIRTYQLESYRKRGTCGDLRSSLQSSSASHTAMICSSFGLASSAVDSALRRAKSNSLFCRLAHELFASGMLVEDDDDDDDESYVVCRRDGRYFTL